MSKKEFIILIKNLEESYKKFGWIIRLLFILFLALLVNFYVLPDLKINPDEIDRVNENNVTYLNLDGFFSLDQNDLESGNLNTILWKLVYLGDARDKICFEKTNYSDDQQFYANYSGGFYKIDKKKCFDISKGSHYITFRVSYVFTFNIPDNLSLSHRRIVNKSECISISDDDTCIIQDGIDNAVILALYPNGKVYLEANSFHKLIKFVVVFFSLGALIWAFTRTIYWIRYGYRK